MSRVTYIIPTRALLGLKNAMLSATRGTAVLNTQFKHYAPSIGEFTARENGSLTAFETGQVCFPPHSSTNKTTSGRTAAAHGLCQNHTRASFRTHQQQDRAEAARGLCRNHTQVCRCLRLSADSARPLDTGETREVCFPCDHQGGNHLMHSMLSQCLPKHTAQELWPRVTGVPGYYISVMFRPGYPIPLQGLMVEVYHLLCPGDGVRSTRCRRYNPACVRR